MQHRTCSECHVYLTITGRVTTQATYLFLSIRY